MVFFIVSAATAAADSFPGTRPSIFKLSSWIRYQCSPGALQVFGTRLELLRHTVCGLRNDRLSLLSASKKQVLRDYANCCWVTQSSRLSNHQISALRCNFVTCCCHYFKEIHTYEYKADLINTYIYTNWIIKMTVHTYWILKLIYTHRHTHITSSVPLESPNTMISWYFHSG